MCQDLDISPEDVVMLPLSFYLRSPSLGTFQRNSYIDGWKDIAGTFKVDSLDAQKDLLPALREDLRNDAPVRGERSKESQAGLFHRVYEFTYAFARPEGQKSLRMYNESLMSMYVLTHAQHWKVLLHSGISSCPFRPLLERLLTSSPKLSSIYGRNFCWRKVTDGRLAKTPGCCSLTSRMRSMQISRRTISMLPGRAK